MERNIARGVFATVFASVFLVGCATSMEAVNSNASVENISNSAYQPGYIQPSDPVVPEGPSGQSLSQEWYQALIDGRPGASKHFFE